MGILRQMHIVKGNNNKAAKIFESLFPEYDFLTIPYESPTDYVAKYWSEYCKLGSHGNSLNGNFFEIIINSLLFREDIKPFYTQAKVAFVPNVIFDVVLYSDSAPVSLSIKTSLRERYKQADLEAVALKYVHRKAKCYLLSLEPDEVSSQKKKIERGDILGLDDIIDCQSDEFNYLIETLKREYKSKLIVPKKIDVIAGNLVQ